MRMRPFAPICRAPGIVRPPVPRAASRWRLLIAAAVAAAACVFALTASAADPAKILRIAQFDIDTLDPQQFTDDPSFQVIIAIFEPLYEWDYLAASPKLVPLTAAAPPEVADGGRVWTLKEWKRGSRLTLEANRTYRETYFPVSERKEDADLVRSMKGKRVPFVDGVEINFIDEDITRLLLFEQGGLDFVQLRGEIATRLLANGKLKPEYAARAITRIVYAEPYLFSLYFNMKDPVVGGMSNERIALRRAIAQGWDADALIKIVLADQAIPANQMIPPGVGGHDPELPVKSLYDPATAKALLDRSGYGKRDADDFRRAPDGSRLTLTLSLRTGGVMREVQTLWKKNMEAIGLRTEFHVAPFQEIIKDFEKGKYQMYQGGFGGSPSGYIQHSQLHGKQPQRVNVSQFANADYDRAADAFLRAASDEEQIAAARTMYGIARTYMPQLPVYFRLESDYVQPWVKGFRPGVFASYWKYLDVEPARPK